MADQRTRSRADGERNRSHRSRPRPRASPNTDIQAQSGRWLGARLLAQSPCGQPPVGRRPTACVCIVASRGNVLYCRHVMLPCSPDLPKR